MISVEKADGLPPSVVYGNYIRPALLILIVLLCAGAVWLRTTYHMTGDTSWLITLGERYLAGERLYIDLYEVNPPASIFLYLPAVMLARYLPLTAETIVICLIFFAIIACLAISAALLRQSVEGRRILNLPILAVSIFVLAIFPGESFTQREQIATILMLPWLSLALLRMEGGSPRLSLALLTGVLGGFIFCIKPLFAAPMALVFLLVMYRRPSLNYVLSPEHILCGAISIFYTGMTFAAFPEFWSVMFPLLKAVYLPAPRYEAGLIISLVWFLIVLMIFLLRPWRIWAEVTGLLICASTGFALVCLWQGKFWTYHFYPMLTLSFLASISACMAAVEYKYNADKGAPSFRAVLSRYYPAILAVAVAARFFALYWAQQDLRPLADAVRLAAPAPVLVNMSYELYTGHPVVRMAGAKWAGRLPSTWIRQHIEDLRANGFSGAEWEKGFAAADRFNIESFRADLREKSVNVIVTSPVVLAWARKDPELAKLLENFEIMTTLRLEWLAMNVHVMARSKPDKG